MPLPSDPSIEYIQRFLRDTIDSSWPAFKAHLAGTLAALPDEKERTEDEARRAVLCDQLKQMKPAYEKEKRTFESQLSTLIATNNANVQQLATTHMLTEQVIGKRPVSPSASFPALKAIRPASPQQDLSTRPRTGSLPASPGTEALVQRISDLQREKAGVYHELGTIFWSIVPTDDEDLMGRLDPSVYAKIVKTLGDVTQEASDCSDYAKFLLHEVDWAGRSVTSICEAKWEGGVAQVWSELGGPAETQKAAVKDEDVRYIMRCFEAIRLLLKVPCRSRDMGERTFDFHAAHDFANLPFRISGGQLLYGENMSAADQSEKHERTGDTNRKGKLVDFLYMIFMNEHGAGENSGPVAREHELHPKEDFVSLARVARSQVLRLTKSGQTAARVVIPFFHIYDNQVGFHLVFEFAPGLFAVHKFFEVGLPTTDQDVPNLIGMCDAFLIFRGIMEQTAKEIALHKPRPGLITLKPVVQRRASLKGLDTPKKGAGAKTLSTKENARKKGSNKRN